ncbi:hypothetical protein KDK77_04975 [bacterium]|nr:hypothetical protein [bacterium]MCP5463221.1 hypothetical protein [bacterium]
MPESVAKVFLFIEQWYHACTNNIYYTIICIGIFIPLMILVIYHVKKFFLPDTTLIHRANKKAKTEKTIIPLPPRKSVKARIVGTTAAKKKYILIPYDEWKEFTAYKEKIKAQNTSQSS